MKFENSIFFEIKSYKGFIFNPIRVFNVLYDEESEDRTSILDDIIQREAFSTFSQKLYTFRSGGAFESFTEISFVKNSKSKDLSELCEYLASVIDDFKETYDEDDPYYTYCYAVLLISIVVSTAGYFPDALLYKFVHFCCKNAILKI